MKTWSLTLGCLLGLISIKKPAACPLQNTFEALIRESLGPAADQAGYALRILDLEGRESPCSAVWNSETIIYPASAIKTLVAVGVFRTIDEGHILIGQKVSITQSNADAECAIEENCDELAYGKEPTVERLLTLMLTHSSNIATNQLVDLVGKDFLSECSDRLNLQHLRFYRKLYAETPAETPLPPQRNEATAADLVDLYEEIAMGEKNFLSPSSRAALTQLLGRGHFNDRINRHWEGTPIFYHKPGNTSTVTSDAGFFYWNERFLVLIAGLQNFAEFQENGESLSGYLSLARVGDGVLRMLRLEPL